MADPPRMRFPEAMAEQRDNPRRAAFVDRGEGETIVFSERRSLEVKYAAPEMVVLEHRLERGEDGPPIHLHKQHTDSFYVLEGDLVVRIDEEEIIMRPGTFIAIPPGVLHTFLRTEADHARFVNVHSPGFRFDEYMRRDAAASARGASESHKKALAAEFDEFQP